MKTIRPLAVFCLFLLAQGTDAATYKVTKVTVAASKSTEYRLFCDSKHFASVILDANKAVAIRPHPGNDVNGWGSTWYPEPFLPGAVLRGSSVALQVTGNNIVLKAKGVVSKGERSSYGAYTTSLNFSFNPTLKQVFASGNYAITLSGFLGDTTGDLNLCKIASNYLNNVPLLGGGLGNTGDMARVDVSDDLSDYSWFPTQQPAFFPGERLLNINMNVVGQYNNVDTAAQGFAPIAAAYKPSLEVYYSFHLPPNTNDMIPSPVLLDTFTKMSSVNWQIPKWVSPTDGTYVGRTQFRCIPKGRLPAIVGGNAKVLLETYNPTGLSFYGTDLIAKQPIALGKGILVTVIAKANTPFPRGIVGGIFLYSLKEGSNTLHDEIDFELLSNQPGRVQTNLYGNESLGAGRPISYPFAAGAATDYHKYQILWLPDRVEWYVDDALIRTETSSLPTGPMYLHISMWAPDSAWPEAYDQALQPVKRAKDNKIYSLLVDSVDVEKLQESPMIFGAMFNQSQSKNFWSDNVGVTPLILKTTTLKSFNFDVEFHSASLEP